MIKNKKLFTALIITAILAIALATAAVAQYNWGTRSTEIFGSIGEKIESATKAELSGNAEDGFYAEPIPQYLRDEMWGKTISEKSHVNFDDLSCVTLTHIGYDGKPHQGKLIVDKDLAEEVIAIFKELYAIKFPIEKIQPACYYNGIDNESMTDNNTSAFNDRPIEGSGVLSYHQLGRAIDINPLVNPYIKFSNGEILPPAGDPYLVRKKDVRGMIKSDSECVRIFKKYGWKWGGDWNSLKDYQHFEKK